MTSHKQGGGPENGECLVRAYKLNSNAVSQNRPVNCPIVPRQGKTLLVAKECPKVHSRS